MPGEREEEEAGSMRGNGDLRMQRSLAVNSLMSIYACKLLAARSPWTISRGCGVAHDIETRDASRMQPKHERGLETAK